MKVLITGSSGFVGNFLVEHLTTLGIEVFGIDVNEYKYKKYDNYEFEKCDVTNLNKMKDIVDKFQPTHIIHTAFVMVPLYNVELENKIDLEGSKNVLECSNKVKSVKQLIFFSSARTYGGHADNKLWINEDEKLRPNDYPYGYNKVEIEEYYTKNKRDDLKVVFFRMCTACGPSYYRSKGLVRLINQSPCQLMVNGTDLIMQFIHEDDVKQLTKLVLDDPEVEGVYNLAPDSYSSLKELAPKRTIFIKISEKRITKIFSFIWRLRIAKITPTSVPLITYGIIISPKKLVDRYNYKFKYTTMEAFHNSI